MFQDDLFRLVVSTLGFCILGFVAGYLLGKFS